MPTTSPRISQAPKAPQRRKGEQTAERILDAAEALFAERGYAGTTLRDVAAAVGLRNPSLYNHFPSKESLYAAVLERGIGPVLAALADFAAHGRDAFRDPTPALERMTELLAQRPNLPRLIQHETLSGGERRSTTLPEWILPVFAHAEEVIRNSPAARKWRPEQIPLLVLSLYHVVIGYFTIAPLYQELYGVDLLSRRARTQQARFFSDLVAALFVH
jgi:AcrR family transcriptional regulator